MPEAAVVAASALGLVLLLLPAQVEQVAAVLAMALQEPQTLVAAVVAAEGRTLQPGVQAVPVLSLFATPEHSVAQEGPSHRQVVTPTTPSHLLGRIQHEPLCPN
jgi:hypothetical protein